MDHVFTLHCILSFYLHKRKRIYMAFLDYKKAFDLVDRHYLWGKLTAQGINGKELKVVRNMYDQAKSCIRAGRRLSNFFASNIGVRQGENLSPLLFSLFINDFGEVFKDVYCGLSAITRRLKSDLDIFCLFMFFCRQMIPLY